eukprot:TRINITY_DN7068_c0_g1_i1.p1 TRINITY_DN7068_c0_g1~~TRINITY_DN7068_c0_g1_i1.p1  ORF type:complete len:267 (+),score=59.50 TRINITY_DN7068_c0_g1_i1:284-1084(+)
MCFDQLSAGGFALLGLYLSWYVNSSTSNRRLAIGVFYFFAMEALQFFQYFWINDCNSQWNQILTFVGFLHICYQPYFTHLINRSLTQNPKFIDQYQVILRLCVISGTWLLGRYFLTLMYPESTEQVISDFTDWEGSSAPAGAIRTYEWLRGEKLCTYDGKYHLAWSVPMYQATYMVPGTQLHSFMMFAPFFVIKTNMIIQGIFLWAFGPFLAGFITDNLQEQASIWCFFSIAQIAVMLFLIREALLLKWGTGKAPSTSIHSKHKSQ